MNMQKIKFSLMATVLIVLVVSCKKTETVQQPAPKVTTGLYSLNQGNYGSNNTTITYYDFGSGHASTDYFGIVNGFGMGDTGSDLLVYGGKVYVVMNNSGNVVVANAFTLKFIDTVDFKAGGINSGPENIVANGSKVFVSNTDGTVAVIDTTSLSVEKLIHVGANPAQMVVAGTNLYVSNTGAFSANYDSTVSVIDLGSLTETQKITVGINPGSLATDNTGNIYVVCTGDYNTVGPSLVKVSTGTNTILKTADTAAGIIRYYNNSLFITGGYLGSAAVRVLNTADFSAVKNFVADGTAITTPYGLDIDNATGDVYIGDAKDYVSSGEVFCFDKNGTKKFSFSTSPTASPIRVQLIQH
jgi:YVTN family beta-propeller protein